MVAWDGMGWDVQVLGLSFMAREVVATAPAGLVPLPRETGICNIDLTPWISLHTDYIANMPQLLSALNLNC